MFHATQAIRLHAMQADMEDGRHVFQEGNAFTFEALQHQVCR